MWRVHIHLPVLGVHKDILGDRLMTRAFDDTKRKVLALLDSLNANQFRAFTNAGSKINISLEKVDADTGKGGG